MITANQIVADLKNAGMFVNASNSYGAHGLRSVKVEQWPTHVLIVGGGKDNAARLLARRGYTLEPTAHGVKVLNG